MRDAGWRRGFALLEKYGLSFDLQLYDHQMADAAELAAAFPETPIILNHTGMPIGRDAETLALWRENMSRLAAQRNVAVKISGLGMLDHRWTVESLGGIVMDTIEIFGPDRCMFASNFPVDSLYSSYETLYEAFKTIVSGLSPDVQQKLFFDNACRIYRLG